MKRFNHLRLIVSIVLAPLAVDAVDPPEIINYQGSISVDGIPFDGTGSFKFVLLDAAGTTTYWSHDGTSTGGGQPASAINLAVNGGLYSIILGDVADPNPMLDNMTEVVPANIFANNPDVYLRVWFDDGSNGLQQLMPDQRITTVGYAFNADTAQRVSSAAITSDMMAVGAVTSDVLADDAVISSKIADGAVTKLDSPDGSLVGVVRADNFGRVGIGPGDPLGNHTPHLTALDSIAADFTFSSPDVVVAGDYAYATLGTGRAHPIYKSSISPIRKTSLLWTRKEGDFPDPTDSMLKGTSLTLPIIMDNP